MALTRKAFIQAALGSVGTAALAACGDDTGSGGGGTTATTGASGPVTVGNGATSSTGVAMGCGATIGANHSHTLTVSEADVMAGMDRTYDIMGGSPHGHMVTITAAQFATLAMAGGGSIMVTSTTTNAHTHTVTVSCNIS